MEIINLFKDIFLLWLVKTNNAGNGYNKNNQKIDR
jgi:hypothetical protein